MEIIILAAGKGTRMKSSLPKVLHKVCGRSLLERCLRAVAELDPQKIIVVVGYAEELVRQEVDRLRQEKFLTNSGIVCISQKDQRGTGHAVEVALTGVSDLTNQVMILPGDVPLINSGVLKEFSKWVNKNSENKVSFLSCNLVDPSGFGRVVRAKQGEVVEIVEHKDCSSEQLKITEINAGIYLTGKSFLEEALANVGDHNAQGERYLTDIVSYAVKKGDTVGGMIYQKASELAGANSRSELSVLEALRRREINQQHMENGVSLEDPQSTYIDEGVMLEADTYIGANTRLKGRTKISTGVVIEGNTFVVDSEIGAKSQIKFSSYLESVQVAENCRIGPFARLRPGTKLADEVHIGNFVEAKNADLQTGAKANHLTYLGDVFVGEKVNVGAGTITCNYDGVNKHKTVINRGAFIGSNSSLVAPLTIGAGSIVGAGSTISKDVPEDSLVVARGKQVVKEGWAKRKREKSN